MNTLEDQLRESLHEYATRPRLSDDVAGTAMRRARAIRGRRTAITTGLAVLAVLAAIGGVALARPDRAPALGTADRSGSTFAMYGVHLDVLEPGNVLRTTDGRTFYLGPGFLNVVRVPSGWLIVDQTGNVALLKYDGRPIPLPGIRVEAGGFEPGVPVPSADGGSIAWVTDNVLHTAALTSDGLVTEHTTPVPPNSFALTWIGPRVVVGQTVGGDGCCGYYPVHYGLWDPSQGSFVPHWTSGLAAIYGPTPGEQTAWANIRGDSDAHGCLGELSGVTQLSLLGHACLQGLTYASTMGLLAPDGLHLADLDAQTGTLMIITVGRSTPNVIGHCAADEAIVWEDGVNLIAWNTATRRIVRCDIQTMTTAPANGSAGPVDPSQYRLIRSYTG